MIDIDYLNFLTENRKEDLLKILKNRVKHFTIFDEDIFQ